MGTDLVMDDYAVAWILYGVGAAVVFATWWWLSRGIVWRALRELLSAMALVLLAVPAQVPAYPGAYAPAWVVALFESTLQEHGNPLPAIALLLSGAVALSLALFLLRWRGTSRRRVR